MLLPLFDHITKCTRHGLSVYIKESFRYSLLQLDTSIQYLAIKLLDRISCVIVYNLPRHQQNFIQNMKDNIIPFMSESCLVMGDFNIQNTETRLQDVMTEHNFIQLINSATHYRPYLHHRFTHCSKRSTSCLSVICVVFL